MSGSVAIIDDAAGIGLPHLDAVQAIAFALQHGMQGFEEKHGDMFRGGINCGKGRVQIEIAMVQFVDHGVDRLFQHLEVDPHAQMVQRVGPHRDLDMPVVAVGIFTVAGIGAQMMAAGKMRFDEDVHGTPGVNKK